MKSRSDEWEEWGADIIFGRARGFVAAMVRTLLRVVSWGFRLMVQGRLYLYGSRMIHERNLGALVISVGNITMGGTGKTPVVELLARTLRDRGRNVAILSRGYKSHDLDEPQEWPDNWGRRRSDPPKIVSDGSKLYLGPEYAGDEPYMLAKNLKGVRVVVDKNRIKSGFFALEKLGADTLILDDGMQYLKLGHELDIVLVDAGAPFGVNALIPRGTLREPPRSLRRASYIFLTKCADLNNEALIAKIRKYNKTAEIIECRHGPKYLENVFTGEQEPLSFLQDKWAACISGIANPKSFEDSVVALGARVEISRQCADHHWFNEQEINAFMTRCADRAMDIIVTTEKDAVRFPRPAELDVPVYFLRIEVEIMRGMEAWERCVDRICGLSHEPPLPEW